LRDALRALRLHGITPVDILACELPLEA